MERLLTRLYTDISHPAAFGSQARLHAAARKHDASITLSDVRTFLHRSATYTQHYPIQQRVKTGKTWSSWVDSDHQADLCVLADVAKHNHGYAYILVSIDVLSRFVSFAPMRRKTGSETTAAYDAMLNRTGRVPHRLATDAGKEFLCAPFRALCRRRGISHSVPKNHNVKCALAENLVRRLKARMYRYFSETKTQRWTDVLAKMEHAFNHTINRAIGMTPVEVTRENTKAVWERLYARELGRPAVHCFSVGDGVRLSQTGELFRKGYKHTYTSEVFYIRKLLFRDPPAYILEDATGEEIDSIVYEQELVGYDG